MNILYLCDEYPPGRNGGIGSAVQLLGRELVKQGHSVIVAGFYDWGYGGKDFFDDGGVKVYRFRRILSSKILYKQDAIYVRAIYRLLRDTGIFQYDIKKSIVKYADFLEQLISKYSIDLVEMPEFCDYMRFCKNYIAFPKLSVPTVVKLHGGMTLFLNETNHEVPPVIWQMEHDLLAQSDGLISVSKYTADKYNEFFKLNRPIEVIYNGIDVSISPATPNKVANRVIFTGTLIEKKGVYQLMRAWNRVIEKNPGAELWLYGKGPVKKIVKLLSREARQSVFFKGHVSRAQLFEELSKASVAVFPSFVESFALAPMEAMLCNTAVIYSSRSSGPELISSGENGLLVDPYDINDIASKILLLLSDKTLNAKLAANGKQLIKNKFDISKIAKENIEYYLTVLK